ncbi:hypothetical protein HMPREF1287_00179 [Corynebacterium sp. KPL1986]|nr:hypothetical protein HMPREF1293_01003 [Corynebacterium sp. KPL1996]ERS45744.1 hypothetical protein HMPREF1287_00179 [Corynebacterium sp. KPL1986]ERS70137.1 hypothetical protein HMPREF1300_01811 [Corynebacterium sp. KPL2004]ERS70693.1 hypothetical protein HMPREF1295_01915 [Corynebacterium sp. KPL1998]
MGIFLVIGGINGANVRTREACGTFTAAHAILRRVAAEQRPKIFEGARDIILSLSVVVVMMLLVVGATGLCSVNPETAQGPVQEVDEETFLDTQARAGIGAIRDPQMPEGWQANAARRSQLGGETATVVSWLTADGNYVESTQTQVSAEDAGEKYDANYRGLNSTREVAGHQVRVLASDDDSVRCLWIVDLGDARLIISGAAPDEEFAAATEAFIKAKPISGK